jgi:phosphohistidine phosphatase SixA
MSITRLLQGFVALLVLCHTHTFASEFADKLQTGHYVLLMRHAYAPGVGDPPGYSLDKCDTQRVLNHEGIQQAARIGDWLRAQGVSSAIVLSSIWCRCQRTAEELKYGPVQIEPALASFFDEPLKAKKLNQQLQQRIANALANKKNQALILVTHHVNIREFVGKDIGSGDMILAQVNAKGQMISFRHYPSP